MAACKTEISDYNSSIAPWHGQALGADSGMEGTGCGTEMQFPFPSLKKPMAQMTFYKTDTGIHPPFPSEARLSGHLGDEMVYGLSEINGTHPPYPSVSHPSAHTTDTEIGIQFPSPSLVKPLGQTGGSDKLGVIVRQFPFPSLSYPDAQKTGTDVATQFPYPSESKPDGQSGV
jgi:hypothetical protein